MKKAFDLKVEEPPRRGTGAADRCVFPGGVVSGERTGAASADPISVAAAGTAFRDQLEGALGRRRDLELFKELRSLDEAAAALKERPTLERLDHYRKVVRELLLKLLRSCYIVERETGFSKQGRKKRFLIVRRIDQELESLSRLVLGRQKSIIELARKLDEIRGLIMDLYG